MILFNNNNFKLFKMNIYIYAYYKYPKFVELCRNIHLLNNLNIMKIFINKKTIKLKK